MEKGLTNVNVQAFLADYEKNSRVEILEATSKKSEVKEILEIAKARGINLKGNRDLAGFKSVYTIADIKDSNGQIVPKEKLLKVLPSMIGKPINLLHQRKYCVGHIIDYKFIKKTNETISYGVFYQSNFQNEWETVKSFFKNGQLGMSSEIWSPKETWAIHKNGSFTLGQMELAGAALVYPPDIPAVEGCDVLAIAMKKMDESSDVDLIFSKKHNDEEILICTNGNCELTNSKRGEGKGKNGKAQGDGGADICVCPKCGSTIKHKKGKPCSEIKCKKCGGTMEGKNKISKSSEDVKEKIEEVVDSKIKCSNCGEEQVPSEMGNTKCSKCFAIIDKAGKMIYPPQIVNFNVTCPNPGCNVKNWLILKRTDKDLKLRCMSCSKEYDVEFAKEELNKFVKKLNFVYSTVIRCFQCNASISLSGVSDIAKRDVKCKKCGLEFSIEVGKSEMKKIKNIKEIVAAPKPIDKSKGGEEMLDKEKKETPVVSVEEKPKEEVKDKKAAEPKVEEIKIIDVKLVDKKVEDEKIVVKENVEEKQKVDEKKEAKKEDKKIEEKPEESKTNGFSVLYRNRIKKLIQLVRDTRKEIDTLKESSDKKVELYKTNAKTLLDRRNELGDSAKDLTDEQIMDDKDFKIAKYEKIYNIKKEKEVQKAVDKANEKDKAKETVVDSTVNISQTAEFAKEINKRAFAHVNKKEKE